MKKKKLMMAVVSASLVGVVAIGGTLAYLSDKSNEVTNTFNVGSGYVPDDKKHIGLWLDETEKTGTENPTAIDLVNRTEEGVQYDEMLPGSVVAKDPTFHLTTGSTDSYVFAQVSGVDAMIADGYYFTVNPPEKLVDPVNALNTANWHQVFSVNEGGFDGLYIYFDGTDNIVEGGKQAVLDDNEQVVEPAVPADTMASLFNWVKLGSGVENDAFAKIEPGQVVIKGVAVQSANLTPEEAQDEAMNVLTGAEWMS